MRERPTLSHDEIRRIAHLARLTIRDDELDLMRAQLSQVLDHVQRLNELDLREVEPMPRPGEITNRFDDDRVGDAISVTQLLRNAPQVEKRFIVVPKVPGQDGKG